MEVFSGRFENNINLSTTSQKGTNIVYFGTMSFIYDYMYARASKRIEPLGGFYIDIFRGPLLIVMSKTIPTSLNLDYIITY
jgi:hypothetical protein